MNNNLSNDFLNNTSHSESGNTNLLQYVQELQPETVAKLSQPDSQEVAHVMEQNIAALLGGLPSEAFDVSITTNRESLGQLLASAMMSGYFLRNAEQRFSIEKSLMADAE
ncbi:DUF760 domain-containing protein [filamentous cyanobacterium LEGE 11480]|uniref:DUF760 domain-containing protein n=1 Tax=Romeriopsis navalis LEGE 11480 TaxID=2777977 RepID=A0A928VNI0_9CYAN|nr:DUF760 domain-containing protein [Romeriopsis navalis]MBE9031575.1 DUF760 domain-containing protein [Romeriopsis navalis LEGE 11480]